MTSKYEPTKEDLRQFREWLAKMPHLIQDYDDEFLAAFIRSRKGSLQKAKERLEAFNGIGMKYPSICGSLDPLHPQLQEHLSENLLFPLPRKTEDDCTVWIMCKSPNFRDHNKTHISEIYRYLILSVHVLIWENNFGSGKWKYFTDCKNYTLIDAKDVTPTSAKEMMNVYMSGFPVRLQQSILINLPPALEYIIKLFKMMVTKKLADRIECVRPEKLDDMVTQKMLPKEYGGCEESVVVLHENWKKKVESYREKLLEEERKMRKLDPLRPKINEDDDMAGTFKRLNVD